MNGATIGVAAAIVTILVGAVTIGLAVSRWTGSRAEQRREAQRQHEEYYGCWIIENGERVWRQGKLAKLDLLDVINTKLDKHLADPHAHSGGRT